MEYQDQNYYVVRSMYLAKSLQHKGFELKKVRINKFYPKHYVYLFENTEELRKEVDKQRKIRLASRQA